MQRKQWENDCNELYFFMQYICNYLLFSLVCDKQVHAYQASHMGKMVVVKYVSFLHVCLWAIIHVGPRCNNNERQCMGSPCQNGAVCMDETGPSVCHCAAGYTGRACETDVDECKGDVILTNLI